MVRALVTGGGGFLGRYVVEQLLARGDSVRVLARGDYPELVRAGVELVRGDVGDAAVVRDACLATDCVFHVASKVGIWGRWADYYRTNVVGSQHLVRACRDQGVGRLVFTSSPSVTFAGGDQCGVDESVAYPTRWLAHYPHSKAVAEQLVLAANGPELRTCALRPHLVWGPRDHHLTARLIERARAGQLRRIGTGLNVVDMIYVENAAEAHLLAADALVDRPERVGGRAFFLSQGEPVNCWEWVDELLGLANLRPLKKSLSLPAAYRLGAFLEGVAHLVRRESEPRMTRFLALQLAKSHWFDISAARDDLQYRPRVSTAEGMERLGQWLAGQG